MPSPFLVLATQNPIEQEGTYPLPEAQIDRFMLKVVVGYPTPERGADGRRARARRPRRGRARCSTLDELRGSAGARPREVYVDPAVHALRRRAGHRHARPGARRPGRPARRYVAFGASPRGPIGLVHAARALALVRGRRYVLPQDVRELAPDVLRHRIVLDLRGAGRGGHDRPGARARARGRAACRASSCAREDGCVTRTRLPSTPRAHAGAARARAAARGARCGPSTWRCARRIDGLLARRVPRRPTSATAPSWRRSGRTCRATTSAGSTGTPPRAPASRTCASTSPSAPLTTWLVLDTSASMTFGTADRRKADVAEGVALALGHVASRRGNRLGLVTFGGPTPARCRPRQGRAGLLATLLALREAARARARTAPTSLGATLERVARVARGRALVVIVGDLRGPRDWRRAAGPARRPPRRARDRDPRPARGGAAGRRATWPWSIPRPAAQRARRHPQPPAARALRRGRRRRARRGRRRAPPRRRRPRRAAHARRLAAAAARSRLASGGGGSR